MKSAQQEKIGRVGMSLLLLCALNAPPYSYALAPMVGHQVSIEVPKFSTLSADRESFTLHFEDIVPGAETNTQVINYSVKANGLQKDSGIVQARLSVSQPGVEVRAEVGPYTKTGGNAILVESEDGFITMTEAWSNLCDKQSTEGSGRVAIGSFPVIYKAVATNYLENKDVYLSVIVTLVDI